MTHTDRLYALALIAAGSLMLVLPMRALAANVDLSNSHATIVCRDGETASIDGSYDTVIVRGHCGAIAVDGDGDVVHADRVDRVSIVGNANAVYYGGAAPQLDVRDGTGNQLVAASAQNAKLTAAVPSANAMARVLSSASPGPTTAPDASASTAPSAQASPTFEPVSTDIAETAARAAAFEATAGAQMGPADVALNGGNASDGFVTIVMGDGANYDAACGGRTVEIGGDGGKVTLHGSCRFIRVSGNDITLAFDGADQLTITGNNDRYRYGAKPGSIQIFGVADVAAR